jgi:hypothetical protein
MLKASFPFDSLDFANAKTMSVSHPPLELEII